MTHMETATAHPHSSLCQLPNSGLLCSAPWAAVGCQNGAAAGGRQLHSSLPPAIAAPHPQGDSAFPLLLSLPWWCHAAGGQVVIVVGIISICQAP